MSKNGEIHKLTSVERCPTFSLSYKTRSENKKEKRNKERRKVKRFSNRIIRMMYRFYFQREKRLVSRSSWSMVTNLLLVASRKDLFEGCVKSWNEHLLCRTYKFSQITTPVYFRYMRAGTWLCDWRIWLPQLELVFDRETFELIFIFVDATANMINEGNRLRCNQTHEHPFSFPSSFLRVRFEKREVFTFRPIKVEKTFHLGELKVNL